MSARARDKRVTSLVGGLGEVLITCGVVILLFCGYEVYWTDLTSGRKQDQVASTLQEEWDRGLDPLAGSGTAAPPAAAPEDPTIVNGRAANSVVPLGDAFARMFIPAFGSDFQFAIVEGTTEGALAVGPGHYVGTAYPGEVGNFAVAGHRVGKGSPFNDLDLLSSCDAVVVETATTWFVYRVLPTSEEVAGWATGGGARPQCLGSGVPVAPMNFPYEQVVGRQIVPPSATSVIDPVPGQPGTVPPAEGLNKLLTLTTCHPRFTAEQRMIIHAVQVAEWSKEQLGTALPPEMQEA